MADRKTLTDLYRGKSILAPMVRIGTLPSRLLSLRFGADLVYSEEMIDFRMLKTSRVENELLGTVDFVMEDSTVAFRTCAEEKDRVVFQIGTSHAKRALKVAKMVEKDVAAIDINMGCPKTFSLSGGMGAALLKQPELVKEILTELVNNLTIPVTCKIRCLGSVEETIEFCKMAQSTGIAAIGLHGRTKDERPRHPCRYSYIQQVANALHIPVIANGGSGEIKAYCDIEKFRLASGASSVMIARAAEWNVSIFRKEGLLDKYDLIKEYIKIAIDFDNHWTNTKYCIQQILGSDVQSEQGTQLLASKCAEDIYVVYDMMDDFRRVNARHQLHLQKVRELEERDYDTVKGLKVKVVRDEQGHVISYESNHVYDRKVSEGNQTPKMYLFNYLKKNRSKTDDKPNFQCEMEPGNNRFRCTLQYGGVKYISNQWHKRKMWAEQAVSQVYMQLNDIGDWGPCGDNNQELSSPNHPDAVISKVGKMKYLEEEVDINVSMSDTGVVRSYSTSHCITCDTRKGNSPVDTLCHYLLRKQMEEPEYDTVLDGDGQVTSCTLRHSGIEYTVNACYSSKKEATNATCMLYLLVHKIADTGRPQASNGVGEKGKRRSSIGDGDRSEVKQCKLSEPS